MESKTGELIKAELTQEEVLHQLKLLQNRLAKKVSIRTFRGAALIRGTLKEGNHNFVDKNKDWNYVVERTSAIDGAEDIVSITRFPVSINSSIVSEGVRFAKRNSILSSVQNSIEYHISTKENPNSTPITNNRETLRKTEAFLLSI